MEFEKSLAVILNPEISENNHVCESSKFQNPDLKKLKKLISIPCFIFSENVCCIVESSKFPKS